MKPEDCCRQMGCGELFFDKNSPEWALIPEGPCSMCVLSYEDYLEGELKCEDCGVKNIDCECGLRGDL